MNRGSVDIDGIKLTELELDGIYLSRLAYKQVYDELGWPTQPAGASGLRYARVVHWLKKNRRIKQFDEVVKRIRESFDREATRVPIVVGPFGRNDSWINWDLAKQLYYYLTPRRAWQGFDAEQYCVNQARATDPLNDAELHEEILNRHIGWEDASAAKVELKHSWQYAERGRALRLGTTKPHAVEPGPLKLYS